MTTFLESPRFPTGISFGSTGGPQFKTRIVELSSGHEQRNIDWSRVRAKYDVAQGLKTLDQHKELLKFFMSVRGRAYGFRFKDHKDYTVSVSEGVCAYLGQGSPNISQFQLYKRYAISADLYYDRLIRKPVVGTVVVYGTPGSPASTAVVDYTTGIIEVPGAGPTATLSWSGQFDVPVRFDTDVIDSSYEELNAITWDSIVLLELKGD